MCHSLLSLSKYSTPCIYLSLLKTGNQARLTLGLFSSWCKTKTWAGRAHNEEKLNSRYVTGKRWVQRNKNGKGENDKNKGE